MGTAVVTENIGEGLYKIRPQFDTTAIDRELATLNSTEQTYLAVIAKAINTRDLLKNDVAIAKEALAQIIQQWKDELIKRGQEQPENLEPDDPNDPETGLPWEDPDRAQEGPLLTAINAARTSASVGTVSRDSKLDKACLHHLRFQAGNGQIGHIGVNFSNPEFRAAWEGYYNPVILHELLAYGNRTPASACASMQHIDNTNLLDPDVTKAGIAYVYAPKHISSYLWAVLLASDEGTFDTITTEDDPAKKKAKETEQALQGINKPEQDLLKPEKLGEVVKAYALAEQKYLAAQNEVERLMAEKLIRGSRITELNELRNYLVNMEPIDCWCCTYTDTLAVNSIVKTMEIPGWWKESATGKTSVLFKDTDRERTVFWYERSINIAANGTGVSGKDYGKIVPSEAMTPAAVAYNYALEPGHFRWHPTWRYGVVSNVMMYVCTVTLTDTPARKLGGERELLAINDSLVLNEVPFYYPPCNGQVFTNGDEVVVEFDEFNRAIPVVIGFRREPKQCRKSRIWGQIT